jgi:hypothetical protein
MREGRYDLIVDSDPRDAAFKGARFAPCGLQGVFAPGGVHEAERNIAAVVFGVPIAIRRLRFYVRSRPAMPQTSLLGRPLKADLGRPEPLGLHPREEVPVERFCRLGLCLEAHGAASALRVFGGEIELAKRYSKLGEDGLDLTGRHSLPSGRLLERSASS